MSEMMINQTIENTENIDQKALELAQDFSYDGYQVVRRELFAHLREPAVVIRRDSVTFNTACIAGLEDAVYIPVSYTHLNDAKKMKEVFTENLVCSDDSIVVLAQDGRIENSEYIRELVRFSENCMEEDIAVVYYSGHGGIDERGDNYLSLIHILYKYERYVL